MIISCDFDINDYRPGNNNHNDATISLTLVDLTHNQVTCHIETKTKSNIHIIGVEFAKNNESAERIQSEETSAVTDVVLTKLQSNTNYTVKPFVFTDGKSDFTYGDEITFTTLDLPEWTLVFADEFDVDGPVAPHWKPEIGQTIRNNEAQYYSNYQDNAFCQDGFLHIVARRNHNGHAYTSASLTTQDSFVFCYGKLEVRAKIPIEGGSWPAIWTLGNEYDWPSNGEVDVMEYYSGKILANACWGSNKQWQGVWAATSRPVTYFTNKDPDWKEKFHIWTMEWDEDYIRLYVDDELLNEVSLSRTFNKGGYRNNLENPFRYHKQGWGHYVLVNLALGGNNGGTIDNSAFPMTYLIDYVRVYQRERLPQ